VRGWVPKYHEDTPVEELARQAMSKDTPKDIPHLHDTTLGNLTEFGRDVHAEMAALTAVARTTVSAAEATLYCTTFPCHNCAKHILAAGLSRVVYVEPYPKSFAPESHSEAIALEGSDCDAACGRVVLQPFSGVAPRKYMQWFKAGRRKDEAGRAEEFVRPAAMPAFLHPDYGGYAQADLDAEAQFVSEHLDDPQARPDDLDDKGIDRDEA
jgi:tRNA(Arg) A34 adenosine deaminase TadA